MYSPLQDPDKEALIARVVSNLADDYHRRGSYISGDHVLRTVEKRGLDPEDDANIRQQLRDRGIEVDDPESTFDLQPIADADVTSDDLVRRYLLEIGSVRLLESNDEIVLARRVQAGRHAAEALKVNRVDEISSPELYKRVIEGQEARRHMITANLRLVVSIAKIYATRSSLDLLDLIQEGTLGLFKAVDKFDHQKGFKLSTYATWWIRQSITRAMADTGRLIRLPVHVNESLARIAKIKRALTRENFGREPSHLEIADQLGWRPEKVQFLLDAGIEPLSLDTPLGDEKESVSGFVRSSAEKSPETIMIALERSRIIDDILSQLSPRERSILTRRFGLDGSRPETLEEISHSFGLTRERIRQIEDKALRKLKHPARSRFLRALWPGVSAESETSAHDDTVDGVKKKAGAILEPKGKTNKHDSAASGDSISGMA